MGSLGRNVALGGYGAAMGLSMDFQWPFLFLVPAALLSSDSVSHILMRFILYLPRITICYYGNASTG